MKKKYFLVLLCLIHATIILAQNMRVITYNIRLDIASDEENAWPNRKNYFCSQLAFYEPDIFGIQEALPHQVNDISNLLPQYNFVGMGREGIEKGESSNIFYKKDRFKLLEEKTFWLSETPDEISKGWDAALNRICTYALLKDKYTKQIFWVFNTHLDHIGKVARTKSIELIINTIKKVNIKNYPVIFMGDFNSEPEEERIVNLKKEMEDSFEITREPPFGPTGTFNGFKHNEPVTKRIDYIFLSKESVFKVAKYAVLSDSKNNKYPSDHLPVYIEIRLN